MEASTKDPAKTRRGNLKRWMDDRSMTSSELAAKISSGRAYASLLFKEGRPFGERAARAIEAKLHMPTGYLDAEKEAPILVADWSAIRDVDDEMYALVPIVEISLAPGSASIAYTEPLLPPMAFSRKWLVAKGVTSKENLCTCSVNGPAMEPTLMDGDVVMIDAGQRDVIDGEIYAIRYGDEIRVSRLFKVIDGGIRIHPDNRTFPSEVLPPSVIGGPLKIIGRKIWRGG